MEQCNCCEKRGKTWNGDDPVCGFDNNGVFNVDNWNCATLSKLRLISDELTMLHWWEDESVAIVPLEISKFIILKWYKNRGRVEVAQTIHDTVIKTMTLHDAEMAIKYHKDLIK